MSRSHFQLLLAVLCLGAPVATAPAQAWWGVGINIGIPVYPRPYYYPYPYYYRPYYYAPPAVVVAPPFAVQLAPVPVLVPTTTAPTVTPVPTAPIQGPQPTVVPAAATVIQASNSENASRVDQLLQQLNGAQENVRRDAAMDLGRMRATRGVEPLTRLLASDTSPAVRDAAARALGLIASPLSLTALIQAAQADNDRDVRHSAQFAVEIIRTNLRSN